MIQPPKQIGYWLSRALRSVAGVAAEILRARCVELGKPYVVTPPQCGLLAFLAANGEQTIGALSQLLAVETPAITGIVTRLEQNGLVRREHDSEDRRVVRVSLTREGRDIIQSLDPIMADLNQRLLPPGQAQAAILLLQEIITRASALAPSKASLPDWLPAAPDFQHHEEP